MHQWLLHLRWRDGRSVLLGRLQTCTWTQGGLVVMMLLGAA